MVSNHPRVSPQNGLDGCKRAKKYSLINRYEIGQMEEIYPYSIELRYAHEIFTIVYTRVYTIGEMR